MKNPRKLYPRTNSTPTSPESKGLPTSSKLELFTSENGRAASETATANSNGQMELGILGSGRKTKHLERASSSMSMATPMRVSGKMIRLMGMECTDM